MALLNIFTDNIIQLEVSNKYIIKVFVEWGGGVGGPVAEWFGRQPSGTYDIATSLLVRVCLGAGGGFPLLVQNK